MARILCSSHKAYDRWRGFGGLAAQVMRVKHECLVELTTLDNTDSFSHVSFFGLT